MVEQWTYFRVVVLVGDWWWNGGGLGVVDLGSGDLGGVDVDDGWFDVEQINAWYPPILIIYSDGRADDLSWRRQDDIGDSDLVAPHLGKLKDQRLVGKRK